MIPGIALLGVFLCLLILSVCGRHTDELDEDDLGVWLTVQFVCGVGIVCTIVAILRMLP